MNKGRNIILLMMLGIFTGVIYSGCKKKKTADNDTSAGEDNAAIEQAYSNVFLSVYQNSDSLFSYKINSCPRITAPYSGTVIPTNTYPKTIRISYSAGCYNRGGYITAYLTAPLHDSLAQAIISYGGYSQGGKSVSASSHVITNKGRNGSGNYVYQVEISGGSISGVTITSSTSSFECIKGSNTASLSDDVFLIRGTREGTTSKSESFTAEIVTPLRIASDCQYIESGVLDVTPKDKKVRVVNFGDSNNPACDDDAYIRIEDRNTNITL